MKNKTIFIKPAIVIIVSLLSLLYCIPLCAQTNPAQNSTFNPVSLPPMPWHPEVDVTPGQIAIVASGRLDRYGSITNQFFRLCEDAGFNVVQCGLYSAAHVIRSMQNADGTSMKFFMRKGLNNPFEIPDKGRGKPTAGLMENLGKINPYNPYWNKFYSDWEVCVSQVLDYCNECVERGEADPLQRIAGCMIYDEPGASYFWGLSELSHRIWKIYHEKRPSVTPLIFGNLFGNFSIGDVPKSNSDAAYQRVMNRLSGRMNTASEWLAGYEKIECYKDYVDLYVKLINPALLSYDTYPFKTRKGKYDKSSMNQFFGTLVEYQNRKHDDKIDFWVYVPCCKFEFASQKNGKKFKNGDILPSPTLGRMRFDAFVSLLYGATGITYWGVTPFTAGDGFPSEFPINSDGTTTSTYESIKTINSQIKGFESILLNSEIVTTMVTRQPPHSNLAAIPGIKVLDKNNSFGAIRNIETLGCGFVMAQMCDDKYTYLFVVSMDSEEPQTATFSFDINNIEMSEGSSMYEVWNNMESATGFSISQLTFSPGDLKIFRYKR